jgi:heme-degrading monooxygenase HmoA
MRAVAAMLHELKEQPALGMLGVRAFPTGRNVTVLQYWRSYEDLQRYADASRHQHAFQYYFRQQYKSGALGIFHETYVVPAHNYEAIFVHMPEFGLGAALSRIPAGRYGDSMGERMSGETAGGEKTPA